MSQSRPTVVVIGAGPAALAALHRLLAEPDVRPVLVAPDGRSSYLPGALAVATGDASIERYRARVEISGVEVVPAAADAIETGRVQVADRWIDAQAIIAAPGLTLTPGGPRQAQAGQGTVAFWDLEGAARVAGVIGTFDHGLLNVVIASTLYRCPPAPYGLAIRLARRARQLDLPVRVTLTTPEPQPLAAIGSQVSKFLRDACADAGVEIFFDTHVDQLAYAHGELRDDAGNVLPGDLTVVIPPHTAHPLLAKLAATGPLVDVDEHGRTAIDGVYAAGDAIKSAYPRATAPAALSGLVATDGALADLGFKHAPVPATPEPDCFIDQGAGRYSRLQLSYPFGPPPAGSAAVTIGAPALGGLSGFDAALERWRASCAGLQERWAANAGRVIPSSAHRGRRTVAAFHGFSAHPGTGVAKCRTLPYATVRLGYDHLMTTIKAEEVRIPRQAREAVDRHEQVLVVSHGRPAFVIVHPDDPAGMRVTTHGHPLRDALAILSTGPAPDPDFAADMEAVLGQVGPMPEDPWARS